MPGARSAGYPGPSVSTKTNPTKALSASSAVSGATFSLNSAATEVELDDCGPVSPAWRTTSRSPSPVRMASRQAISSSTSSGSIPPPLPELDCTRRPRFLTPGASLRASRRLHPKTCPKKSVLLLDPKQQNNKTTSATKTAARDDQ